MMSKITALVEAKLFQNFLIAVILFNAVTLGLETTTFGKSNADLLHKIDTVILLIFTFELVLKLIAYRLQFFKSGWNCFDLIIVAISWVPAGGALSVLRAFRILRVLRLFSVVPQMRKVIGALGHSLPGMASVVGVLGVVFYVSAVLTTKLFGQHPDPNMQEWFGSIGASSYTLFQVMTLESWSMGIVRPTMELFPYSWLFFIPFIVFTSFAVLNLFIGIIVDAMQVMHEQEEKEDGASVTKEDIQRLEAKLDALLQSNKHS
ncbi:ion transporter [Pseudoalteromonas luteoviolacea]|uniref:Voltage-gated sodium channel n=1 Tax=Pseudoalteromonas luteoviolacea H33 TaxID=1365251 RepID=A0A167AI72_9GAMM|nr:ion transporter [Pseudoalteromonas luteoviolacea]KZN45415.1 voltage-gated sodium channel [Pseudoalteromonas luteoviolacea H33]KZN70721.1 voltage-gated sodium channel [Pseudoalteromonas luteoviolacea H33-S]MBQ4879142.1 ion transporter [Pseudoalteromonas luteoviolacea]MBQ4908103.1 ion transporter [Pseudoalteromonas luteoviolacea]